MPALVGAAVDPVVLGGSKGGGVAVSAGVDLDLGAGLHISGVDRCVRAAYKHHGSC